MTNHVQTDEEIAKQIIAGRHQDFSLLVRRYEQKLRRYGWHFSSSREGIEDVVQEVFLKAFQNLRNFDLSRRFSPWIYRIAHNEFINALRKQAHEPVPFFDPDTLFPHPLSTELPSKDQERHELRRALDTCLHLLDPKFREPVVLYYFEDLPYRAIADVLHIPLATVGVRLNRAKVRLKRLYESKFLLTARPIPSLARR